MGEDRGERSAGTDPGELERTEEAPLGSVGVMNPTKLSEAARRRSSSESSEAAPRSTGLGGAQFEEVFVAEREFIGVQDEPLAGLAFSGGGIRSAAFSLGVLQALVAGKKLENFHYLSTVSGGGYTGTALTWWLHQGLPSGAQAGTSSERFPLGSLKPEGEHQADQNAILNFTRQHASYMCPTPQLGLLSALSVVLRSAFVSLSVYFALLTGALGMGLNAYLFGPAPEWISGGPFLVARFFDAPLLGLGLLLVLFLASSSLVYGLVTRLFPSRYGYEFRTKVQQHLGQLTLLVFGCFVFGLLPIIYGQLFSWLSSSFSSAVGATALSLVVGIFLGGVEGQQRVNGEVTKSRWAEWRPLIAIVFVLLGLLLGAFAVADGIRGLVRGDFSFGGGVSHWFSFASSSECKQRLLGFLLSALLFFGGGVLGWFSNVNYLGAHRMYRDRLMELFTPNKSAVREQRWESASSADATFLSRVGRSAANPEKNRRPYHLINTNVVLVDSESSAYRGRGGDSFFLAPLYSGSHATGWVRSEHLGGKQPLSLPSAMAISGAALNPNTGASGRGPTRGKLVSLLLGLLNLRLGYWIVNPNQVKKKGEGAEREAAPVPNLIHPGLSALFGYGLREDQALVELSDGGHFENLGIYELVRRRTQFIVVCDGGQDGDYEFADLANAVERVRVDFGVKIEFGEDRPLQELVPGSGSEMPSSLQSRFSLARRAFAEGTIRYPGDTTLGRIVYIKTTLFSGLPADVLGYKLAQAEFPHESTTDQFFDERQFEAYRELGYYSGWNYLDNSMRPPFS